LADKSGTIKPRGKTMSLPQSAIEQIDLMYQTRDEAGNLEYFTTFEKALTHARDNKSVWKISWTTQGGERIRLIREGDRFFYENLIEAMWELFGERSN
jgi:hypothetical protein